MDTVPVTPHMSRDTFRFPLHGIGKEKGGRKESTPFIPICSEGSTPLQCTTQSYSYLPLPFLFSFFLWDPCFIIYWLYPLMFFRPPWPCILSSVVHQSRHLCPRPSSDWFLSKTSGTILRTQRMTPVYVGELLKSTHHCTGLVTTVSCPLTSGFISTLLVY